MHLQTPKAVTFIPDGIDEDDGLRRTTHMGIGAHQDDLEIMAIHGILRCYRRDDAWFAGVVVSDGAGSPRSGRFKDYTNEQMVETRVEEQIRAARLGGYGSQILLLYPSDEVKDPKAEEVIGDLVALLDSARPQVVYTHSLFDKHDAHVAVAIKTIQAIRRLPQENRPRHVFGCEVWRDLDWLVDHDKVVLDCSQYLDLQERLLRVFSSQVVGGKRYDLAALGRRRANATYLEAHQVDATTGSVFAIDLLPLVEDDAMSLADYMQKYLDRFYADVVARLERLA